MAGRIALFGRSKVELAKQVIKDLEWRDKKQTRKWNWAAMNQQSSAEPILKVL